MLKDGEFTKVDDKMKAKEYIMEKHYGAMHYKDLELGKKMEYVVSPGVCNKDYGGPLYYEFTKNSFKTFIVTGLVNV